MRIARIRFTTRRSGCGGPAPAKSLADARRSPLGRLDSTRRYVKVDVAPRLGRKTSADNRQPCIGRVSRGSAARRSFSENPNISVIRVRYPIRTSTVIFSPQFYRAPSSTTVLPAIYPRAPKYICTNISNFLIAEPCEQTLIFGSASWTLHIHIQPLRS